MQIAPKKYKSIPSSFAITWREEGVRGFLKGHFPTFIGYSFQVRFSLSIGDLRGFGRFRALRFIVPNDENILEVPPGVLAGSTSAH
jgi:hypothetical protein